MPDLAVKAESVGKRYRLGQQQTGYQLLSEALAQRVRSVGRRRPPRREDFWALEDVGFEVAQGESFGIIGHNGAGKSTLLKILSRVTPPTTGEIRIRGRVGALLEVGTGFHGELTGRENIFLNGSILGMRRTEVQRKFDQIVEFAEVEQFIDTPVKRYSSGMYLRLAFSVAAHLEPEILIVDEVLAVGDAAFQQKCLGRMGDVASEGRTVLFVSHNLTAVSKLCARSMMLDHGRKVAEGPTPEIVDRYIADRLASSGVDLAERTDRQGSGRLRFESVRFVQDEHVVDTPVTGRDLIVGIGYRTADGRDLAHPQIRVTITTLMGQLMLFLESDVTMTAFDRLPPSGEIRCALPRLPLPAGRYVVELSASGGQELLDWIRHAAEMTVAEGDFHGTGRRPSEGHRTVLVEHGWSVAEEPAAVSLAGAAATPPGRPG